MSEEMKEDIIISRRDVFYLQESLSEISKSISEGRTHEAAERFGWFRREFSDFLLTPVVKADDERRAKQANTPLKDRDPAQVDSMRKLNGSDKRERGF